MGALEIWDARKEAKEMQASGACVWMPPAPDFDELLGELSNKLLDEASGFQKAKELAVDWDVLANDRMEIIRLVAEAHYRLKTWEWDERSALFSALGRDIYQLVKDRITQVAKYQLEREGE